MPKTVPGRRIVVAAHDMIDPERKRLAEDQRLPVPVTADDMAKPETPLPGDLVELTYEQRLQRQIKMLNLAMGKHERVLSKGGEISDDAEKRLMSLVDASRKLELALAQIRAKSDGDGGKSDLEIALFLLDKGLAIETVKANFAHNPGLADELEEALSDRQE